MLDYKAQLGDDIRKLIDEKYMDKMSIFEITAAFEEIKWFLFMEAYDYATKKSEKGVDSKEGSIIYSIVNNRDN